VNYKLLKAEKLIESQYKRIEQHRRVRARQLEMEEEA
jgi:hypothetical protein